MKINNYLRHIRAGSYSPKSSQVKYVDINGEAVTCFLNLQDHYWNVPMYRFELYFQTKMKGMSMKNFEKGQCLPNCQISFTDSN